MYEDTVGRRRDTPRADARMVSQLQAISTMKRDLYGATCDWVVPFPGGKNPGRVRKLWSVPV